VSEAAAFVINNSAQTKFFLHSLTVVFVLILETVVTNSHASCESREIITGAFHSIVSLTLHTILLEAPSSQSASTPSTLTVTSLAFL
jgi:hypothetical protein